MYMGPPGIAVVYFRLALNFTIPKNENPADMLMDIIGGKLARDNDPRFKPASLVRKGPRMPDGAFGVGLPPPPPFPQLLTHPPLFPPPLQSRRLSGGLARVLPGWSSLSAATRS